MKKILPAGLFLFCFIFQCAAQNFLPITTTGYNLDAVAENTTALATTGGVIDGSNYVLYSQNYGSTFGGGSTTGLPNSGLVAAGTRTFQLCTYSLSNMLYLPNAQADTLYLSTPAPYPSLSLLAFATEGTGNMNVKVRFTDGSSQSFNGLAVSDWFAATATNIAISGFDRVTRPTGVPNYTNVNPKMFYFDLSLTCANRLKNVQRIIVQSTIANPRICVMALAGSSAAIYSVQTTPVTCAGGSNGTASVSVFGGLPPFTYTWSTTPVLNTASVNLPIGASSYTVGDAANCSFSASVNITQSIVPNGSINIVASQNPVCSGASVTLSTSGANSYTWSTGASTSNTTSTTLASTSSYSVVGTTSLNCTVSGLITVSTTALPIITFTSVPIKICSNAAGILLSANPPGGTFSGQAITFGTFFPNLAGPGTFTLAYAYTDANNCSSVQTITTTVGSPTTTINFALTTPSLCTNSSALSLTATPAGGTFSGTAVSGSIFSPSVSGVGTFNITYTYTDANNCVASKINSMIVKVCSTVGIIEIPEETKIQIYPNPNNGSFMVKSENELELNLINALGSTIRTIRLNGNNSFVVLVDDIAPGVYFVQHAKHSTFKKVIVTR